MEEMFYYDEIAHSSQQEATTGDLLRECINERDRLKRTAIGHCARLSMLLQPGSRHENNSLEARADAIKQLSGTLAALRIRDEKIESLLAAES